MIHMMHFFFRKPRAGVRADDGNYATSVASDISRPSWLGTRIRGFGVVCRLDPPQKKLPLAVDGHVENHPLMEGVPTCS